MAAAAPGEVRAQLPGTAAGDAGAVRRDPRRPRSRRRCPASRTGSIRGSSATSRPTARSPSVLGDYVSTGLGVLGLAWQSSPALTELEEVVTDWMRQMVGLSERVERRDPGHGVDQHAWSRCSARASAPPTTPGARRAAGGAARRSWSMSRRRATARSRRRRCWPGSGATTCALVPLRRTPTRCGRTRWPRWSADDLARGQRALRRRRHDRHDGDRRPSTRSARSPSVAQAHGLWLHVDAAMAGSAMILPECRWLWDGRRARGLAGRQPAQVARRGVRLLAVLRARPEHLVRVMSTNPSYLQTAADGRVKNLPRLGHPARPAVPRAEAVVPDPRAGRRRRCRRGCGATWRTRSGWPSRWRRRRAGGCSRRCRCRPCACATSRAGLDGEALDAHTLGWADRVNRSGAAYLTPGDAGRPLDGARLDRRRGDGAGGRGGAVGDDAGGGGGAVRKVGEKVFSPDPSSISGVGTRRAAGRTLRE